MARGFDSKSVADQQEEKLNARAPRTGPLVDPRRKKLELARVDLTRQLETATGAYAEMLRRSLAALDEELAKLG
jgi:pyridoxine 5'-phosphate synthase PdxJ